MSENYLYSNQTPAETVKQINAILEPKGLSFVHVESYLNGDGFRLLCEDNSSAEGCPVRRLVPGVERVTLCASSPVDERVKLINSALAPCGYRVEISAPERESANDPYAGPCEFVYDRMRSRAWLVDVAAECDRVIAAVTEKKVEAVRLLESCGGFSAGCVLLVKRVIPHGGNYDCGAQYETHNGPIVPSNKCEPLYESPKYGEAVNATQTPGPIAGSAEFLPFERPITDKPADSSRMVAIVERIVLALVSLEKKGAIVITDLKPESVAKLREDLDTLARSLPTAPCPENDVSRACAYLPGDVEYRAALVIDGRGNVLKDRYGMFDGKGPQKAVIDALRDAMRTGDRAAYAAAAQTIADTIKRAGFGPKAESDPLPTCADMRERAYGQLKYADSEFRAAVHAVYRQAKKIRALMNYSEQSAVDAAYASPEMRKLVDMMLVLVDVAHDAEQQRQAVKEETFFGRYAVGPGPVLQKVKSDVATSMRSIDRKVEIGYKPITPEVMRGLRILSASAQVGSFDAEAARTWIAQFGPETPSARDFQHVLAGTHTVADLPISKEEAAAWDAALKPDPALAEKVAIDLETHPVQPGMWWATPFMGEPMREHLEALEMCRRNGVTVDEQKVAEIEQECAHKESCSGFKYPAVPEPDFESEEETTPNGKTPTTFAVYTEGMPEPHKFEAPNAEAAGQVVKNAIVGALESVAPPVLAIDPGIPSAGLALFRSCARRVGDDVERVNLTINAPTISAAKIREDARQKMRERTLADLWQMMADDSAVVAGEAEVEAFDEDLEKLWSIVADSAPEAAWPVAVEALFRLRDKLGQIDVVSWQIDKLIADDVEGTKQLLDGKSPALIEIAEAFRKVRAPEVDLVPSTATERAGDRFEITLTAKQYEPVVAWLSALWKLWPVAIKEIHDDIARLAKAVGEENTEAVRHEQNGVDLSHKLKAANEKIADLEQKMIDLDGWKATIAEVEKATADGLAMWRESNPDYPLPEDAQIGAGLVLWALTRVTNMEREHASHIANVQHASNHAIAEAEDQLKDAWQVLHREFPGVYPQSLAESLALKFAELHGAKASLDKVTEQLAAEKALAGRIDSERLAFKAQLVEAWLALGVQEESANMTEWLLRGQTVGEGIREVVQALEVRIDKEEKRREALDDECEKFRKEKEALETGNRRLAREVQRLQLADQDREQAEQDAEAGLAMNNRTQRKLEKLRASIAPLIVELIGLAREGRIGYGAPPAVGRLDKITAVEAKIAEVLS